MATISLIGFCRKSKNGNALNISISKEAFMKAEIYTSSKGGEYVSLTIRLSNVWDLINGRKEVVSVNQIIEDPTPPAEGTE